MQKIKHTLVTRWKLILVVVVMCSGVLALLCNYPPVGNDGKVDSIGVAAWVQGVGTVLAVLAAAWIARDQFDWQQRAEEARRRQADYLEVDVLRDTLAELDAAIQKAQAAASSGRDAFDAFFKSDGAFDNHAFDALNQLLRRSTLSPAHGPTLHIQLHKAEFAVEQARQLMTLLRQVADATPQKPVEVSRVSALAVHRDVLRAMVQKFEDAARALERQ